MEKLQAQNNLMPWQRWHRRGRLFLGFFILLFLVLEFRFDIVERGLGLYLVWQNDGRQKVGRSWVAEQQQLLAGTNLEKFAREMRDRDRELNNLRTFPELVRLTARREQVVLPPEVFSRVYNSLPNFLNSLIVLPDSLLYYRANGILENVVFNQSDAGLQVILLDDRNRILLNKILTPVQMDMLLNHGKRITLDVTTDERFSPERVFSLARFQELLDRLSYARKNDFLYALPAMVQYAGPAMKVAVSDRINDGLVQIAVAVDNIEAYVYFIPEDWINDLILVLDEEDFIPDEDETFL